MSLGAELLIVFALTAINGFFSAAEISILSVRRTRLAELAAEGKRSAAYAVRLREQPERFLATVQVGITVVGATAGAFGGATMAEPVARSLEAMGMTRGADQLGLALVVALVSTLSIVFGELVPKSLALRSSERISLAVARPIAALSRIARPVVWSLTAMSNLVLRPFRDNTNFSEARLSPEELQNLVEEAANTGSLAPTVGDIASRAIELGQLAISALMIPRNEVVCMPIDANAEQVWSLLRDKPHARYPVVRGGLDTAEGYVVAHDLVRQLMEKRVDVAAAMREVPAFSERTPAVTTLRQLQEKRCQFAVVVDEHGMTAGIVTVEDIMESLAGEIFGEYERPDDPIRMEDAGVAVVRADTPVQEVNRRLGAGLPVSKDYATLSGLLMHASSRIMRKGQTITVEGVLLEVLEATPRTVKLVRVHLPSAQAEAEAPT